MYFVDALHNRQSIIFLFLRIIIKVYMILINDLLLKVYFKATDPFNERWQSGWIITAFWDILAFALLCVICYLWAPSLSSQRYITNIIIFHGMFI